MHFDFFARRWVYAPDGVPSGGQAPAGEETPQPTGQAPAPTTAHAQDAPTPEDKEASKLRAEAAKWRTQLRETQDALKAAQAEAGENKKLADQLASIQAQLAKTQADAEAAQKASQLTRLAVKAGMDPDVAALLDLSKIDLADEKKALEVLSRLKGSNASGGAQAKPGNGVTGLDGLPSLFGGRKTTIFGG